MLSEGVVPLTRSWQGPGVKVHTATAGQFVTLYLTPYQTLNDEHHQLIQVVDDKANATSLRVVVGESNIALVVDATPSALPFVANLRVEAGEEVWISTTTPSRHAVHGFAGTHPRV